MIPVLSQEFGLPLDHRNVYEKALAAQGRRVSSWTPAQVKWFADVVKRIDLSRLPWSSPILLQVQTDNTLIWNECPRLQVVVPILFSSNTGRLHVPADAASVTLSMMVPVEIIRTDADVVELVMRFVADSMIHELREAGHYKGHDGSQRQAFDPHYMSERRRVLPNPPWDWTGSEPQEMPGYERRPMPG